MTFEEEFPSLKGKIYDCDLIAVFGEYNIEKNRCGDGESVDVDDVKECCLDKQRVLEVINTLKLENTYTDIPADRTPPDELLDSFVDMLKLKEGKKMICVDDLKQARMRENDETDQERTTERDRMTPTAKNKPSVVQGPKRGEEIFIYPPDTFLKPILLVSRTRGEVAIKWVDALNPFHVIGVGIENLPSSGWIILSEGENTSLYDEIIAKLKGDDDWTEYLNLWKVHCGKKRAAEMEGSHE